MNYKVFHYNRGKKQQIKKNKAVELEENITNCLGNVIDRLRLYIDEERIQEIYNEEKLWEVIYDNEIVFNMGLFGEWKTERILLPQTGDLVVTAKEKTLTILTISQDNDCQIWLCNGEGINLD